MRIGLMGQMRLITLAVAVLGCGAMAVQAQTETNIVPPVAGTIWDALTTGTNYFEVNYATVGTDSKAFGGGLAIGYKLNDAMAALVRADYFDGEFYMASLSVQLQVPRRLMGKVPAIPFGEAGAGIPFSGAGAQNGSAHGIIGAGVAVPLDIVGKAWLWQHSFLAASYEHWTGMKPDQANQVRFGLGIKF